MHWTTPVWIAAAGFLLPSSVGVVAQTFPVASRCHEALRDQPGAGFAFSTAAEGHDNVVNTKQAQATVEARRLLEAADRFTSSSDRRIQVYGSTQLPYSQSWRIQQLIAPFSTRLKNSSYSATSSTHCLQIAEKDYASMKKETNVNIRRFRTTCLL